MKNTRFLNWLTLLCVLVSACTQVAPQASTTSPLATSTPAPTQASSTPTRRLPTSTAILPTETQPAFARQQPPSGAQPNIVFILTDDLDLRLGSIEYMPNLQLLLVDQGLSFADYFVSNPLCCPSRATTLTGQYSHTNGILNNNPPAGGFEKAYNTGLEESTVAVWLQEAGYRTVLMGKYLNGYPPVDNPNYVPPGWSEWYSPSEGQAYGNIDYTLNENGELVQYGHQPEDYLTDVMSGKAVDFIQRSTNDEAPFFLYLSTYAPHSPSTPAQRHAGMFPDAQAPRTPSLNEADKSDKPAHIQNRGLLDEQALQQNDLAYRKRLQSLQAVDEMIAALVATLEETGALKNTYIIFTSDNGYHMGQHGLRSGKNTPYEEDINVPFIVRGPGLPAGETLRGYLAGNVDLAPTFAELGEADAPDSVEGRSLVPLLTTSRPAAEDWRQAFLIEGYSGAKGRKTSNSAALGSPTTRAASEQDLRSGILEPPDPDELEIAASSFLTTTGLTSAAAKPKGAPSYAALRTLNYLYVEYASGERELYDLQKDPYQLENLAAETDQKTLAKLSGWLKKLHTCTGAKCRSAEQKPAPRLALQSLPLQALPLTNAASGFISQYILNHACLAAWLSRLPDLFSCFEAGIRI